MSAIEIVVQSWRLIWQAIQSAATCGQAQPCPSVAARTRQLAARDHGDTSIATIASRGNRSERAIRKTLSLAFLDLKLVKAVLQGALLPGISAHRLVEAPATSTAQWQMLGLTRPV